MGKRGPPPLPDALKKERGTFQPCRSAPNAVAPPVAEPPRPDGLDAVASAKWNEVVPRLIAAKVVAELDGQILESYCRTYSRWRAYQALAETKPMVKTPYGPKVNPAAAEARKWEQLLNQCGDRLGLSPSARTRVSAVEPPAEDGKAKAAKFLFGGAPLQVVAGGKSG